MVRRARFFFVLAFRNLTRHRRRTVVTALAMAVGISIYTSMDSILVGFISEIDRNLVDFEIGNAAITAPEYWDERHRYLLDRLVEDPEALLRVLEEAGIPAAPRTTFRGDLIVHYDPFPEDGSVPMVFAGLDPELDSRVFRLREAIVEGRWLESGREEIVLGRWLAEQLGAEVGYPVSVTTRTRDGYRQFLELEVAGIYESPNPYVDRNKVHLPLDVADLYLEMKGAVTSIHLKLPEAIPGTADPAPARRVLEAVGAGPVVALSYADMTEEFTEMMEMEEGFTNLLLFLLAIIAIVGVSNTMLMSVLEREREIGMLRSLGLHNREIRLLFSLEAAGIGVLGAIGGLALGSVFTGLLVTYGVDYSRLMSEIDFAGYRFDSVLYGVWNYGTMVSATVFAVLVAGVVAIFPTRRILKKSVTDCLRHV
ncbi:MAG: ABC transporter permease [Spirochaetaceae bacterium]|nr:MAG: ABC transporter permease [Spirochaetaceae bacterium]